jgi:hypothetical protein
MKITDLEVKKEWIQGEPFLVCRVKFEDGNEAIASHPWLNVSGLWASSDYKRSPQEIAAVLRNFAKSIDDYVKQHEAA